MKRKPAKTEIFNVCGTCAYATPDRKFENLSLNGEPTLVSCPFRRWKQNVGQIACIEWKQQTDCAR